MLHLRTLAAVVALLIAAAQIAYADDYGPQTDIRAIRRDLPVIHARDGHAIVDAVVVGGDEALVQWHEESVISIDLLHRLYDRWAYVAQVTHGGINCAGNPVFDSPLWGNAERHLPIPAPTPTPKPNGRAVYHNDGIALCDPAPPAFDFNTQTQSWLDSGYLVRFEPTPNDASKGDALAELAFRTPTKAESWEAPGGDSYFFLSATVESRTPIHVRAGTTIDVWFPFALETNKTYSLTIGFTDEPIGPIDGTLKDNSLHFVLPAFSVHPGAHLMGEIDGD